MLLSIFYKIEQQWWKFYKYRPSNSSQPDLQVQDIHTFLKFVVEARVKVSWEQVQGFVSSWSSKFDKKKINWLILFLCVSESVLWFFLWFSWWTSFFSILKDIAVGIGEIFRSLCEKLQTSKQIILDFYSELAYN